MKDIIKTARGLDKYLNVLHVLLTVVMVILTVCLCLIGGYFLFDLDPSLVGSDFDEVDFGMLTLTVADDCIPDLSQVFLVAAGEMVLGIAICFLCQKLIACFQGILAPMKEGSPFQNAVSRNLSKAVRYILLLGILGNLGQLYEDLAQPLLYDLPNLILNDKITHFTIHYTFDLSFLIFAAVLFLLGCVFRYGEELQQLSDETL